MQIVINIPDEEYEIIKKSNAPMSWAEHLIKNGVPLPKGHGRLIDADEVSKYVIIGNGDLKKCPTIIEADRSEES